MSEKDAQVWEQGRKVQTTKGSRNRYEDFVIRNLDKAAVLKRYEDQIRQLEEGTLKLPGFMKQISIQQTLNLLAIQETTTDAKLATNIAQDLLDRAGYGKISKVAHAHAVADMTETKRELVNKALSLAGKAGFKVKKEKHVEADSDVIDVEPSVVSGDEGKKP